MKTVIASKRLMWRLNTYLSYLKSIPASVENVSAAAIANALNLGEVLVRKDLAKIAQAGRRRIGRNREQLIQEIETCIEHTATKGSIVIGTGRVGQALLNNNEFDPTGLNILAGFDSYPSKDQAKNGIPIYHLNQLEAFCKRYEVYIGMIAVPDESGQMVCDRLVDCGISVIWNFTRANLSVPDYVVVQNENFVLPMAPQNHSAQKLWSAPTKERI